MKIFEKTPAFVISYLLAMLPTYLLPYFGSNSAAIQGIGTVTRDQGGDLVGTLFFIHIGCLAFLIAITWIKGKASNRGWIAVFPVVAAFFDMLPGLSLIPLVPTLMHVLAIIFAARGQPEVVVVEKVNE